MARRYRRVERSAIHCVYYRQVIVPAKGGSLTRYAGGIVAADGARLPLISSFDDVARAKAIAERLADTLNSR